MWVPIPEFGPDAFDYVSLTQAFLDKTPFSYPFDLPLAFPLLVYIADFFSDKALFVIWLHFLFKFFSGFLLISVFCKYYSRLGIAVALLISIYITDSWSLRYDTCFIPDSLYSSFLMTTVSFFIISYHSLSRSSLLLLSVSIFLVAFTRSNGIYIYYLIPVMLVLLVKSKERWSKYACLLLPALLMQGGAIYLKSYSGILNPQTNRLTSVLSRESDLLKTKQTASYAEKKWGILKEYLLMSDFPSFYFSLLPVRYERLYEEDAINDPEYKMFDWTEPIPDDLRRLVYREYYNEPELLKENRHIMELSYAYSHPLYMMIHLLYKLQSVIFRNVLWYLFFFGVFLFACWRYAKSSFTAKEVLLVIFLCSVHILGMLTVVIGNTRVQLRYAHVSEFLLYLAPVFLLMIILPAIRKEKTDAQQ